MQTLKLTWIDLLVVVCMFTISLSPSHVHILISLRHSISPVVQQL